ncbi:MAG TPA: cation:proton antiporter [Patescibacteria group bacterium]|nr:cation:proton antiporter [Patescibacteria group bacterium]
MHETVFAELSLIIAIAAGVALLMRLIRQPLIIGHILTGVIVGPSVLHLVQSADTINVFSSIGIALLLFIIGLGLNPRVVKEVGKVASITGVVQVAFITMVGYGGGLVLGMTRTEALFFGVALAFSSTIIILKLLSDKKEQTRLYGKVTTGILLVQDIIAAVALLFITAKSHGGIGVHQVGWLVLKGSFIAVPLLLIGNFVLPRLHKFIAGSQEFLFLFAIGWGFGAAALFDQAGFSLEVGALLAGIALASLPYAQEIASRLRPLRDFFIIVFFITLGTRLSFDHFALILPAIIFGTFAVIVLKPLVVMGFMGLLGYTKRTSFKTAVSTAQISEFSLVFVILGSKLHLISNDVVSIITIIALVTIACSAYLIIYADKLFEGLKEDLSVFERKGRDQEHERRHSYAMVLFGYRKGGQEFLKLFESLERSYVVVDYDPEVIDMLEQQKANFLYGDVSDAELLEEIGLQKTKLVVSAITDYDITLFLVKHLADIHSSAVIICHAETVEQADELYELGASYVMMPHYIGSEKISALIRRSGLKKSEFKRFREKHLAWLHSHYETETDEEGDE